MAHIKEPKPGHLQITCPVSGLPFTRTTELGMFCAGDPCECEVQSQQIMSRFTTPPSPKTE